MPIRKKGRSSSAPRKGRTSEKISRTPRKDVSKSKRAAPQSKIGSSKSTSPKAPPRTKGGRKPSGKKALSRVPETLAQDGPVRLNRYIANSGVCSRREADTLITMGVITVNGKVITELGYRSEERRVGKECRTRVSEAH